MPPDPYRKFARNYDRVFASPNLGLIRRAFELCPPRPGMRVLDVGCGTGEWLAAYRDAECEVTGIDLSESMAAVARRKLGEAATIVVGDAAVMPFGDGVFDIVTVSFALHEMSSTMRAATIEQIKRVLASGGRVVAVDFHAGKPRGIRGRLVRSVSMVSEVIAGRTHYRNGREFLRSGGIDTVAESHGLACETSRVSGRGNFDVVVLIRR